MGNVFQTLVERGLIAQCTNLEKVEELLENKKISFYIGFDATADSLHIGHFLPIILMMHMQRAGHRPIALLGTGTTMVGDPTGKTDMRKMLSEAEIDQNARRFQQQISRYIDFSSPEKGLVVRNGDWLKEVKYIEFLRNVGVHFSVNRMLAAECFKSRLEKGLSFIEFNYMIMQSYDFYHLHQTHGAAVQFGGDDQWSNIIGGVELTRKMAGDEVYGLTIPLLVKSDGKKMGKTESGALWLDPQRVSPYEFFQYWRNIEDESVSTVFKRLTFVPLEEIYEMESWQGTSRINEAKERLAFEITQLVHGTDKAQQALEASRSLFIAGQDDAHMPTTVLVDEDFPNGTIGVLTLLTRCKLTSSNAEARRLVQQGGIAVDGTRVEEPSLQLPKSLFAKEGITIKKGKKVFHKVKL